VKMWAYPAATCSCGHLNVDLLADMALGGASDYPSQWRVGNVVDGVTRFREPPGLVIGRDRHSLQRRDLEPAARVVDVLPADLIGQPRLVVRRGIELVESSADAIRRILIARREVVFARHLRGAPSGQRSTQLPVTRPRLHIVGPK
jgi:hypothetical protein